MPSQVILRGNNQIKPLLKNLMINKIFVVHSRSYNSLSIKDEIESTGVELVYFGNVKPNPLYEDICEAVSIFNEEKCNAIMAIGGGSVIDTAKCIKLFCRMNNQTCYLEQTIVENQLPLITVPTTAGAGSESTRFAVIYHNGEKQSLCHESIMPNYAVLVPELLSTLPLYQKKCTFLDALCQGIESWWSVNLTEESKTYSKIAVEKLIISMNSYFSGDKTSVDNIMEGANYAGKAINITQTTAPHAMSYKLTTKYGLPHGHAVAICLPVVWHYMFENLDKCTNLRDAEYTREIFEEIAQALGYGSVHQAIGEFSDMLKKLEIYPPKNVSDEDINILSASVNQTRLKNSPICINEEAVYTIYKNILRN